MPCRLASRQSKQAVALAVWLLLLLGMTGCAWLKPGEPLPVLLPLSGDNLNQRFTYHVEWQDGESTDTFLAILETHAGSLQLVAILPTGITLFSFDVSAENRSLESSALASSHVLPDELLAILQLCSFTQAELGELLPTPWHLKTGDQQRSLFLNDTAVLEATIGDNAQEPVIIHNFRNGHVINIKLLSKEPLS